MTRPQNVDNRFFDLVGEGVFKIKIEIEIRGVRQAKPDFGRLIILPYFLHTNLGTAMFLCTNFKFAIG